MNPSQLSLGQRPIIIKQSFGGVKLFLEQFGKDYADSWQSSPTWTFNYTGKELETYADQ